MSSEALEVILYRQVQEGLSLELIESPSVSGVTPYQELDMSARNEKQRQMELRKRKKYHKNLPCQV